MFYVFQESVIRIVLNFSRIEIMLKYFIQEDIRIVVNNPWECFQLNSKDEERERDQVLRRT